MNRFCCGLAVVALLLSLIPAASARPTTNIATGFNSQTLPGNDNGSAGAITLPFEADFFGTAYNNIYINNNGNLTFAGPYSTFTPYGLSGATLPIIAPFFADVYTASPGSGAVTYGNGTYAGNDAFGVTWSNVDYYGEPADGTDLEDTFQAILVDRSDTGSGNFDIYFNYGTIQWETGDASGGYMGMGGSPAVVGFATGGGLYYEWPGSGVSGAFENDGSDPLIDASHDGIPGQLLFQVRNGEVINSGPLSSSAGGETTSTPEPASLLLLGTGLLGLSAFYRTERK